MEKKVKSRNVLDKLSSESREKFLKLGKIETRKKGDVLFIEREKIEHMYIILEGYVSLYRNSKYGDERVIFICTDGEIVNEVCLQDNKTSIAARALSDLRLLKIYVKDLDNFFENDYEAFKIVYNSLAHKLRRLYRQTGNSNGTFPIEKRLAARIWKLARDYGKDIDSGRKIKFEVTVTLLASMVGAKRETVSRIISKMKKEKLIKHDKGVLIVTDMDTLKTIV
ncbi:Crp/Fnr family transcriptional regulator [Lachnospira pectinoschiza]|uniref:cAMP-binding domain of CRP or a regulatory subunit of cAMP-dependent protein kinases n=1 Tax=Lachnospira pectinoschiza TaxID=28052 RepID=A0A1G9TE91_9FIRM|nr:Crp/Fnr family transcriptional regulator [Lachnospira pectinoschiza]SDM46026.1 cAMP-binding domain of CRP or a regulatory subunit of cAMP-dependent protein kinases [Lachnospira pectinoschiza]